MATGLSTQLTRQIGEHLVAAKLGRMGYIAAPFAGNVPLFDLVAADASGFTIPIQVKAINGPSWQYKADAFLEIELIDGFQHVRGKKALLNPALVCIYILLAPEEHKDEYFIFSLQDLQEHTFAIYKSRKRPKNPTTTHCAVWPKDLAHFRDNWDLLEQSFAAARPNNSFKPKPLRGSA
ncbi:MAG: hypothetical protein M3485_05365 [Pseudomonadota bacterium]|nr:hypothetical protein [Pseudomonadota bacterium]